MVTVGAPKKNPMAIMEQSQRSSPTGCSYREGSHFLCRVGTGGAGATARDVVRSSTGSIWALSGPDSKATVEHQGQTMGGLLEWMDTTFLGALCPWGYVSINSVGWPEFAGNYVNYPWFKKDWWVFWLEDLPRDGRT
jgi:hypothetical protein